MTDWTPYAPNQTPAAKRMARAVALKYDPDQDHAPRIVATGAGLIAEEIINIAHEHDVPIHDDPLLVEALAGLDIDAVIPPELYKVVAEVFAFIVRVHMRSMKSDPPGRTSSR
ncbi:MAG: EscU/YscU/HrcU family type III secretion system export apparatus switch protein [Anaerolineales bacterium]|nr:EscU/YscU/HrcU family type III secretion system export apparatus switch protein [Anaerolineales bacterium]